MREPRPSPSLAAARVAALALALAAPAAPAAAQQARADHPPAVAATVAATVTAAGLIGRDVVGPGGERVGEVADLLVEPDGTVGRVVVAVGGFLGIGARPVALDLAALRVEGPDGASALATALPREALEALPRLERDREGRYAPRPGG